MSEVNEVNEENNAPTSSAWLNIWIKPKETVRAVINRNKNRGIIFLVFFGSYATVLRIVSFSDLIRILSLREIFLSVVVLGSIGALIFYYLVSVILQLTGRWIGGKATYKEIKLVNGYISITAIWCLVILIPQIILVTLDKSTPPILTMFNILINIWIFIIYLKSLAEVQRFSAIKSLLNVSIVSLIMYITLFITLLVIVQTFGKPPGVI
ncbi:YIP1 family protein [Alkaliphilus peptidifermentans]|uniref:Yip1 domain-containing protein n=1 Tax=Alkaliphilus peptidifermentans DSM 18978 TaxID=1120976 RepID=A0A1G5GVJ1_9FIRM|nr:YIP1 family protein [Alkaliphilus peptidifermentans]SCY54638.1 Yip1 domain-containing protein [Alkaliphilus peptidifermentans DSM 18978]